MSIEWQTLHGLPFEYEFTERAALLCGQSDLLKPLVWVIWCTPRMPCFCKSASHLKASFWLFFSSVISLWRGDVRRGLLRCRTRPDRPRRIAWYIFICWNLPRIHLVCQATHICPNVWSLNWSLPGVHHIMFSVKGKLRSLLWKQKSNKRFSNLLQTALY